MPLPVHPGARVWPHVAAASLLLIGGCQVPPAPGSLAEAPVEPDPVVSRITLGSGLVIEDVRLGDGDAVVPGSLITVLYTASLSDGAVFDGTADGRPRTFPLPRMIEGWRQGLIGMRTGGVRRLRVPAGLAYGPAGCPPLNVPPDADLSFRIELVSVEPLPTG